MILCLKKDSTEFHSRNRKREREGHRAQQYNPAGTETSRYDRYSDDCNSEPVARGTTYYANEPEPRRYRAHAGYDDDKDIDAPPMNPRDPRYGRDPRDSRARPPVSAGYTPSGGELYAYDSRSDPRGAPVASDSRWDSYADPQAAQSLYLPRGDPYGGLPPQVSAIPRRGGRDEPQMFIDPRTGQPTLLASSSGGRTFLASSQQNEGDGNPDFDGSPNFQKYARG